MAFQAAIGFPLLSLKGHVPIWVGGYSEPKKPLWSY